MPILRINLQRDAFSEEQLEQLLERASELYASVLDSPLERVRVFLHLIEPGLMAIGGKVAATSGINAPFFEAIVLEGRPQEQKQHLMAGITGLLEEVLQVERKHIRGACWTVPPEDWCIAGTPASAKRAGEIAARKRE